MSIPDCGYLSTHSASIRYKHTNTISFFNSLEHPQSEQIENSRPPASRWFIFKRLHLAGESNELNQMSQNDSAQRFDLLAECFSSWDSNMTLSLPGPVAELCDKVFTCITTTIRTYFRGTRFLILVCTIQEFHTRIGDIKIVANFHVLLDGMTPFW